MCTARLLWSDIDSVTSCPLSWSESSQLITYHRSHLLQRFTSGVSKELGNGRLWVDDDCLNSRFTNERAWRIRGCKSERKKAEFLGLFWRNVWNGTAASTRSDMSGLEMWISIEAVSEMGCSCRLKMVHSGGGRQLGTHAVLKYNFRCFHLSDR